MKERIAYVFLPFVFVHDGKIDREHWQVRDFVMIVCPVQWRDFSQKYASSARRKCQTFLNRAQ